jgi:hypothetical protein
MTEDRRKPPPPLRELKGVQKHYYDEFSGAEFEREASLFLGSKVRDVARRRVRVLDELRMLADEDRPTDNVPGASNWVPLGPAGLPRPRHRPHHGHRDPSDDAADDVRLGRARWRLEDDRRRR